METTEAGIRVMCHFMACHLRAVPDPHTGDAPWSIGWEHTGPDVHPGLEITKDQADRLLRKRLFDVIEPGVEAGLRRIPTDWQFDAMVCLARDIGVAALRRSPILILLNRRDHIGAAMQFPLWRFSAGKDLLLLRRRRHAERKLFEGHGADAAIRSAMEIVK